MLLEKKPLSFEDLEVQTALELPTREMMLVTVVITNVLNNLSIDVNVEDIQVALQICAVINDVNAILVDDDGNSVAALACAVRQGGGGGGPR